MSDVHADVCVVGGGPAGAAAAITLARAGRNVAVFDRARFPRDKCCGDGLTTAALRRLQSLGLDPSAVPSWQIVDDVWVRSPSGRTIRFPLPSDCGTYAAIARRSELDAALLDVAREAGARVYEGHALVSATQDADSITLTIDGMGDVRARYAIGADGVWSPLAKALGVYPSGYRGDWHAFRQYFADVGPAAEHLWVWFEPDLLPGYAWSFPLPGGRANVGFGRPRVPGQPAHTMKQTWTELLGRPHVRDVLGGGATAEAPHKTWPIPARVGASVLTHGRALFAGDAAGVTDPLTGEGIAQALETGTEAAGAVVAAGPTAPEWAAAAYRRSVAAGIAPDHRLARLLSRLLANVRGARGAIRLAGATDWTRCNFARWLFEDYPRAVLLTPRRWQRHVLAGPGAYR